MASGLTSNAWPYLGTWVLGRVVRVAFHGKVCGPGYFGTRNVADEIVDARELTDAGSSALLNLASQEIHEP